MTDPDLTPEAVERLAQHYDNANGHLPNPSGNITSATLRALSADRDRLRCALEKAVLSWGEQAMARGEAEGRLAASEMAGVVDGWKARAEAAESALAELEAENARLRGVMGEVLSKLDRDGMRPGWGVVRDWLRAALDKGEGASDV